MPGDSVLFATAGPGQLKNWAGETLRNGVLATVTRGYYRNTTQLWSDELYEHRFGFRTTNALPVVSITTAGAGVL